VGIYLRISLDADNDQLGVQRQEEDCLALAERLGWQVVRVYVDNDLSAFSGKRRPEYEALCEDLEARVIRGVVTWHPDRLHRRNAELESFIDLIDRSKAKVTTVQAGLIDLSTPTGKMTARIVGAVAQGESEHKGERVKRRMEQNAKRGVIHGGTRTFGYDRERDPRTGRVIKGSPPVIVPAEAAVVRELAQRVIAGETLYRLAAEMNERGVATVRSKAWTGGTVKSLLTSPAIAGLRSYNGQIVGEAQWPAIIDRATLDKLRAILMDESRWMNRSARTYLLSGLVQCSTCGARMVSHMRYRAKGQPVARTYACEKQHGGCGHRRIVAEPVDELVAKAVVLHLAGAEVRARLAAMATPTVDASVREQAETLDARDAHLAREWAEGRLSDVAWDAAKSALAAQRQALNVTLRREGRVPAVLASVLSVKPAKVQAAWDALGFDRQRAVLKALGVVVQICPKPAGPQANKFNPERVTLAPMLGQP
jgi:DNA invertase Pin-like site-specific DNA recombinase